MAFDDDFDDDLDDALIDAFIRALVDVAAREPGANVQEAIRLAAEAAGVDPDDEDIVDAGFDQALEDAEVGLLAGDVVVHPPSLFIGSHFTHVVSTEEAEGGFLSLAFDLAPLDAYDFFVVDDGELDCDYPRREARRLLVADAAGPRWAAGDTVVIAIAGSDPAEGEATLVLQSRDAPPEADRDLVEALRRAYDFEVGETHLPVQLSELICRLLLDDPAALALPQAPLTSLVAVAGLELRGNEVAHDEEVWDKDRETTLFGRLFRRFAGDPRRGRARAAAEALEVVRSEGRAASALFAALADGDIADVFVGTLLTSESYAERLGAALERGARRPADRAIAMWWKAVCAENSGDVAGALDLLERAVAESPECEPAADRLAWYRVDAGDAQGARRLWSRLAQSSEQAADMVRRLDIVVPSSSPREAAGLGRNDPCWCGSGRKYKVCHLGRVGPSPLPDRIAAIVHKLGLYAGRQAGGEITDDMLSLVAACLDLSQGKATSLGPAMDSLMLDALFFGCGWLRRFVDERGALLPADERELLERWLDTRRTLVEVEESRPGEGITVFDLRSGERHVVRERLASAAMRPGTVWCARVVPDGEGWQFVLGVMPVPPGTEKELFDLLDDPNPEVFLSWAAASARPPVLTTREGEALVACTAELEVHDAPSLREALGELYQPDGHDEWVDLVELDGERVLRASLRLDEDGTLEVSTMSAERMDRVLAELAALRMTSVRRDERSPLKAPSAAGSTRFDVKTVALDGDVDADAAEAIASYIERYEEQWCDMEIPALGGLTPRQAMDDPTRRETLERLLASFPEPDAVAGGLGMRKDRIRSLLGLPRF